MNSRLTRLVRDPISPAEAIPLIVLLHGLGSDERDLMELAPELDPRFRVVTLRAPHRWTQGGYAWFELTWDHRGIQIDPIQVQASLESLVNEVRDLCDEFKPPKLVIGGFSQGAMMSLGLILRNPELVDGAMLLSGRHVPEMFAQASPHVSGMPVLVQHGIHDPVLEVNGARAMRDALDGAGAKVEYHEYPMAHEVSLQSLLDAQTWLTRQLS